MRQIGRAQRIFERFSVRPTYVVDYPVASQPEGFERLKDWAMEERCIVGAHLHPWVTPPYEEEISSRNSYTGNLPPRLQDRKIRELTTAIGSHVGTLPRTFKAGRYGISGQALETIDALGYEVDASVNPHMDFRPDAGPDFTQFDSQPFWFGRRSRMLEVPCTQGYTGWARAVGATLRRLAEHPPLNRLHAPGLLARSAAVDQVMLSPEGNTLAAMIALTRALLADGLRVFSLTFHSPSVEPGHTPYVRSQTDLKVFLERLERYLEFFFGEARGIASTPEDFRRELLGTDHSRP
jgi:hypothetical protein